MTHKLVLGLGLGDESKGSFVDYLCATEDVRAVIRFNGGPQAAHNVVTPDGRHHTFAQFGSGTFHGVPTHLSRFMLFNPLNLMKEREHLLELGLEDPLRDFTVSRRALLVTPYHRAANRAREDQRGDARHGSTGQGVGEVRAYEREYPVMAIRTSDMNSPYAMNHMLELLRDHYTAIGFDMSGEPTPKELTDEYYRLSKEIRIVSDHYTQTLLDEGDCVFEGAQGALLDELYGFNPHTTWTKTTKANALELLEGRESVSYGLTRTYMTRHGAGPMPTEFGTDMSETLPEPHNGTGRYQGAWRRGALDLSLLTYAFDANDGVDHIVVSHMDVLSTNSLYATSGYNMPSLKYGLWLANHERIGLPFNMQQSEKLCGEMFELEPLRYLSIQNEEDVAMAIDHATGLSPSIYSYGPTWKDKQVTNLTPVS